MAKIHTEQAVSDFATQTYNHQGNAGQYIYKKGTELVEKGEGTEQKAKKEYSQAVQIDWQNSMNAIANNPKFSANPTAMQAEMKKLNDKMASEIVDDDVKMDFYVNAELKGQTYLNNATAKFNKIQDDNTRALFADSIRSGIDTEAAVLSNGMTGVGNASDLANAVYSNDVIAAAIERKNPDGSYMFNESQRREFEKERETAAFNSFKASFGSIPEYRRKEVYDKIKNDKMSFGVLKDKDGNEKELYLQDVVSSDTYNKYKEFVQNKEENEIQLKKKELAEKKFAEELNMYQTEQKLSIDLDSMDTNEALHVLEQNEGIVSDKFYKAKQKSLLSSKGINAETRAEYASDILLNIAYLHNMQKGSKEYINEADKILTDIEEKYANGSLSFRDKNRLSIKVSEKIGEGLPSFFKEENHWFKYDYEDAFNDFNNAFNDKAVAQKLLLDYFRTMEKNGGEYPEPQRISLAKSLIKQYTNKEFDRPSFRNVQEMQEALNSGKIKEGDIVYVNGQRGTVKL